MLVDPALSGLPAFLTPKPGLNPGFMIPQVTAAALVSENKQRAYPASVDSIPTSANQEDHVSMAAHGARRLLRMAENATGVIAHRAAGRRAGLRLPRAACVERRAGARARRLVRGRGAASGRRPLSSIRTSRRRSRSSASGAIVDAAAIALPAVSGGRMSPTGSNSPRGDAAAAGQHPAHRHGIPPDDRAAARVAVAARKDADWWIDRLYDFARELGATDRAHGDLAHRHRREPRSVGRLALSRPGHHRAVPDRNLRRRAALRAGRGAGAGRDRPAPRNATSIPITRRSPPRSSGCATLHPTRRALRRHSIRSVVPRLFDGELPQFNIGTNDGAAAATRPRSDASRQSAPHRRSVMVINGRFRGGWITRHYGEPANGVHAIQMELACAATCASRRRLSTGQLARRTTPNRRADPRHADAFCKPQFAGCAGSTSPRSTFNAPEVCHDPTHPHRQRPHHPRRRRGTELTAKSWLTEAPLRMLMNNLDPDVAERPEELVVYGGIGRAARDWESFDRIVATLRGSRTTRRCWSSRASRSACSAPTPTRRAC